MDEAAYQRWWALHVRAARGGDLTDEEQRVYQAGLRQLHQEEDLPDTIAILRQTRSSVAVLEAEHAQLQAEHDRLNAEIAQLEAALSEPVKRLLGVKD